MGYHAQFDSNGLPIAFYVDGIHSIPEDATALSDEDYATLRDNQGRTRWNAAAGAVESYTPPAPPFEEQREAYFNAAVRPTRERILNRLAGIGLAAQATNDASMVSAVLAARQQLLDITQAGYVVAATDMDGLKAAVVQAYHAIVDAAPAELKTAFNGVDL